MQIDPKKIQTNIVIFAVGKTGMTSSQLVEQLDRRHILTGAVDSQRVRLVTHRDVSRSDCESAVAIIGEVVGAGY